LASSKNFDLSNEEYVLQKKKNDYRKVYVKPNINLSGAEEEDEIYGMPEDRSNYGDPTEEYWEEYKKENKS